MLDLTAREILVLLGIATLMIFVCLIVYFTKRFRELVREEREMNRTKPMVNKLKKYYASVGEEKYKQEWQKIVDMGLEGPPVKEFLESFKKYDK